MSPRGLEDTQEPAQSQLEPQGWHPGALGATPELQLWSEGPRKDPGAALGCPGCGALTPCPGGSQTGPSVWRAGTARCWRGCSAPRPRRCCRPARRERGGKCVLVPDRMSKEGDRHHGVSAGVGRMPGIVLAFIPITQCGLQRNLPQPTCRCWRQHCWYLVLEDLVGHQLLQEVPVHGVARLCPAARGGPLERDKAERAITCLGTQGHCHSGDTGPRKRGWRAKGYRCTRSRVLVLAQSSGEGPAPADPGSDS